MNYRIASFKDNQEIESFVIKASKDSIASKMSQEGQQSFLRFSETIFKGKNSHLFIVAQENGAIRGVLALRHLKHISLLFVEKDYQHQGVGRTMIEAASQLTSVDLEVNAFDGTEAFYSSCGFKRTGEQWEKDGIVSLPMCKSLTLKHSFANYDEVVRFINSQKARVYSLTHFQSFMRTYLDPQMALRCVHIGGTNGKGSTTNYVKEVMMHSGYHVGTFTSPPLISRLDVIQIDDLSIAEEDMVRYSNRFMEAWTHYELSMFEIEVFCGILYFLEHAVDLALFEVGLGGTLDATNIIHPLLAVNTNIGLDHVDYLGHTYTSIATNKAGIVKEGVDYMTGETRQECLDVFAKATHQHHSRLIVIDHPDDYVISDGIAYDYHGFHVHLDTTALYQVDNSALAINILEYIRSAFPFEDDDLIMGMAHAHWAGRFEVVHHDPLIIIDGAHNKEGMDAFYASASHYDHIKIIFSALRDKDTHHMIETLLRLTDDVTICEFDFYRAQSAEKLAEDFPVKIEKDWHQAIDEAYFHKGVVFVTGSLYFISQVRTYIMKKC